MAPPFKIRGICCIEGCGLIEKSKGWCAKHYQQFYKTHPTYFEQSKEDKRNLPHYMMWFERKQVNLLSEEWLDVRRFVFDITPRPGKNFTLVRLDNSKPFGPANFKWQENLYRKEGENNKDWWARKWAARQLANPGLERRRSLKRYFNITPEQYDEKLKNQNGKCAICGQTETALDGKSGALRRLAIDHNHETNVVRELLCWRCNGTLGRIDESIKLLQAMINYLNKHKDA